MTCSRLHKFPQIKCQNHDTNAVDTWSITAPRLRRHNIRTLSSVPNLPLMEHNDVMTATTSPQRSVLVCNSMTHLQSSPVCSPMNWNQKNFVSLLPVLTTLFLNATWVLECPDNIVSICWTGKEPWARRSFHNRISCLMKYLGRGRFELQSSSLKVWVLTKWEK